jgi:hypothetical protein
MRRALLLAAVLVLAGGCAPRASFPVEEVRVRFVAGEAMDALCVTHGWEPGCGALYVGTNPPTIYVSPDHFPKAAAILCRLKVPAATTWHAAVCIEFTGHELRHAAEGRWHR